MRYKNESKSKSNGVVYTPVKMAEYVAAQMLQYSSHNSENSISILDPAVGEGELLIALINSLSDCGKSLFVVGYETDEEVGIQTQKKLKGLFPQISIEIRIGDFLSAVEENSTGLFDFVIANPPYIRTQILGSERAQKISERLNLSGRIDIYYAFLVYTKEVLKPSGIAGYITSNKFMTIKAGNSVRNFLLENYSIHHIIDLGDTKLFNASVLPCILVFSLGQTLENESVRFTSVYQDNDVPEQSEPVDSIFDAIEKEGHFIIPDGRCYQIRQGTLQDASKNALWTLKSDDNEKWLSRVEANTWITFSQIGKVRVGIKTTADNVFIGDKWNGDTADLELLKPLITHRNAGQIVSDSTSHWKVLYTHTIINGKKVAVDIDQFPKSKSYLLKHYDQLAGRDYVRKAKRNWYEIWVPQNPDSWSHKKIVFRDISEKPEFWFDATGAVVNGDCYWIDIYSTTLEEVVYLALAVANSDFIERYYDVKFNTKLYSGKRRYQTQYVDQFPIPFYGSPEAQETISIMKQIIESNDPALVTKYKGELNHLVNKMFS